MTRSMRSGGETGSEAGQDQRDLEEKLDQKMDNINEIWRRTGSEAQKWLAVTKWLAESQVIGGVNTGLAGWMAIPTNLSKILKQKLRLPHRWLRYQIRNKLPKQQGPI